MISVLGPNSLGDLLGEHVIFKFSEEAIGNSGRSTYSCFVVHVLVVTNLFIDIDFPFANNIGLITSL